MKPTRRKPSSFCRPWILSIIKLVCLRCRASALSPNSLCITSKSQDTCPLGRMEASSWSRNWQILSWKQPSSRRLAGRCRPRQLTVRHLAWKDLIHSRAGIPCKEIILLSRTQNTLPSIKPTHTSRTITTAKASEIKSTTATLTARTHPYNFSTRCRHSNGTAFSISRVTSRTTAGRKHSGTALCTRNICRTCRKR